MVEGARLESVYRLIAYRGFESLSLRQMRKGPAMCGAFYLYNFLLRLLCHDFRLVYVFKIHHNYETYE